MHFDLHKDEKQKEEKKEIFLIIINDQSGGSIQKLFLMIDYEISADSQP